MAAPATEHVRNVVLVGQDGSGKTSLAEAMLHVSGKTPRMGTTHDGKSYLDFDDEEIRHRFTISSALAPIPFRDFKINVIDTSGQPDFLGDTLASMQAAETALVVVDAVTGPQVMHTMLWREAEGMRLCRAVFINHIDRPGADFDTSMALLHARFGSRLGPVAIPIGVGEDFRGIIDVLRMKARYFEGGSERIDEIPDDYLDAAMTAREKLCDLVAEADDELMMKYLDGEEMLTQAELEMLLGRAIADELFIPVFVGSTIVEQGIENILEDIAAYFPSPTAHGRFRLADGEETFVSVEGEPSCFVFKTLSDPYVGRLSFVKVITGVLEPGQELVNSRTGKRERLGHLYVMMGKEAEDVKSAKAGDIVVVPKLGETLTGDTLSLKGDLAIDPFPLPEPLYPVALEVDDRAAEDKLAAFVARAVESDPTLRWTRNPETRQSVLTCLGEGQVENLLSRLKAQTGIEARLVDVRIPYRETISVPADAQGRHKKQTGGAGQFGDCTIKIEPNYEEEFVFVDAIKGGAIPGSLIPAVEKGIREAMEEGFVAGYPLTGLTVTLYDGSYHSVDSNEMAFKTAGRIALRNALENAKPVVLEPMADMAVTVSEEYAGAVMGDIATRRGRIVGTDSNDEGETVILVRVPYAEVVRYAKDLRSLTRGSGSFTLELNGYEQAPGDVQARLVEAYEQSRA